MNWSSKILQIYSSSVQFFLGNYRFSLDHKCRFYWWDPEKYSVEHKGGLSSCGENSRGSDVSGGTNILRIFRYWFHTSFSSKSNTFYVWDLEKYSVEDMECLWNCAEISRGSKISGGTNILRNLRHWLPTGFSSEWNTAL